MDRVVQMRGELRRGYFSPRLIIKSPPGQFGEGRPKENNRHFNFEIKLDQGPGATIELVQRVATDQRYSFSTASM